MSPYCSGVRFAKNTEIISRNFHFSQVNDLGIPKFISWDFPKLIFELFRTNSILCPESLSLT